MNRPLTPSLSPKGERVPGLSAVALAKAEGRVRGGSWPQLTSKILEVFPLHELQRNIEHRTSNAPNNSMSGVRCWMFDVSDG